jgi:hypothetical protein
MEFYVIINGRLIPSLLLQLVEEALKSDFFWWAFLFCLQSLLVFRTSKFRPLGSLLSVTDELAIFFQSSTIPVFILLFS